MRNEMLIQDTKDVLFDSETHRVVVFFSCHVCVLVTPVKVDLLLFLVI